MSVKHVRDYYRQLSADYKEMVETVHDLEEAVSEHLVDPDQLKSITDQLEIIKTNYMRIEYIMFLLDMPNKKEKIPKYKQRLNKVVEKIPVKDTLNGVHAENKCTLNKFNNDIQHIKESD